MAVVLISGATSGIGLACAKIFANSGDFVYSLGRSAKDEGAKRYGRGFIRQLKCDVTDYESLVATYNIALQDSGRLDLVIINAGYGIAGAIEETKVKDFEQQFGLNFFASSRLAQLAARTMREQSFGRIIFVSSLASALPIPFQAFYSASKAALTSLCRSLAMELGPLGVKVSCVMPGDVSSSFAASRVKNDTEANSAYAARQKRSIERMEKDERSGKPADFIAKYIFKLAAKKRPKSVYIPGWDYKFFYVLSKVLPLRWVDYILKKLYAS